MEYTTKDFYISACLLASNIPLLRLVPTGNSKSFLFVFSISPSKAETIIEDHWNRKLTLPTRDFIEAINELKTRLYNKA